MLGYFAFVEVASPPVMVGILIFGGLAVYSVLVASVLGYQLHTDMDEDIVLRNLASLFEVSTEALARDASKEDVKSSLVQVCDHISRSFSELIGENCSVCIKGLEWAEENGAQTLAVETLCRDSRFSESRGAAAGGPHYLDSNTDFKEIHRTFTPFVANDLPGLDEYQNTSFQAYGRTPTPSWLDVLPGRIGEKLARRLRWPLPYKSTIVAPIKDSGTEDHPRYVGYLCLDSKERKVFEEETHPEIVQALAVGLYPLAHQLNTVEHGGDDAR